MLTVRLLGRFEVSRAGSTAAVPSRPAQSLFAYLILHPGTAHRREKLAGMLWPDSLEETARDNLRHALWRLRKSLPSGREDRYVLADDLTIAFNAEAGYWLDAQVIEQAGESATADELVAALGAYGGELLPGFYDEWVVLEREHLQASFNHCMARLMSLLESGKRWLDILDWAERWIKLGQKPEPAYRALMRAHAAKGDMAKVAATYERCAKSLSELGIEPSEQNRELYKNLSAGKDVPGSAFSVAESVVKEETSNIPVPLTSFIGREKELEEIARLLSTSRLVTLTGPGGVGKTRLAIQSARDLRGKFKDGAFWVNLVGLSERNLVPQEIAQALSLRQAADEPMIETLKAHLGSRDILLVLDNCEHLISTCAEVVEQLLAACPRIRILATSIEALGLFNETSWQIPSLPLPRTNQVVALPELRGFASIELFDERARHAKSGYALNENTAKSVAQICQRLDGIPLAIELAAARTKVLSVDEIASRLDDRFSLLTAGSRTAIPRHQTLRATIDWSYDLLTQPERILFCRLSVFAGGFTLQAAESVCSLGVLARRDILDLLGRLVDKSLVIVENDPGVDETRYHLLKTIRQYALERLVESGEEPAIRDHHVEFFVQLAEEAEPKLYEASIWARRIDQHLDNIRAAMEWSTNSGEAVKALRIGGSLVYYWFGRGWLGSEWHDLVGLALSHPAGKERTLARAKALNGFGFMYWADIYPTDRRPELEEALSIAKEFGDDWNIGTALRNLGLLASIQGDYREARALLEESLEVWRGMGSEGRLGGSWTMMFLGDVAFNQNEAERARAFYEEAMAAWREHGNMNFLGYAVRRLGLLALREGDHGEASALCRESLVMNQEVDDPRGVLACLAGFGDIAVKQTRLERAAQLMAAVEVQLATLGIRLLYIDEVEYQRHLALLRASLDAKPLDKNWTKGKSMTLEQAIALALAVS